MTAKKPPLQIVKLRDAFALYVSNMGPDPGPLEDLDYWYLVESEDDTLNEPDVFIDLHGQDFSDSALRETLGLDDGAELTDQDRINYARERTSEQRLDEDDVYFLHDFDSSDGTENPRLFCCTAQMVGQGGYDLKWYGLFSEKSAFRRHLNSLGYYDIREGPYALTDAKILEVWQRD